MKNMLIFLTLVMLTIRTTAQSSKINYNTRIGAIYNVPYLASTAGLQIEKIVIPTFQGKLGWSMGFSASKQLSETSKWFLGVDFDFMRKRYGLLYQNLPTQIEQVYKQDFVVIRPSLGYSFSDNLGIDFGPYVHRSIGPERQENAISSLFPAFDENENVDYGASIGLNFILKPINVKLLFQQGLNGSKGISITDLTGNQIGTISSYSRTYHLQVGYNF